jgi:hypothetical protein
MSVPDHVRTLVTGYWILCVLCIDSSIAVLNMVMHHDAWDWMDIHSCFHIYMSHTSYYRG